MHSFHNRIKNTWNKKAGRILLCLSAVLFIAAIIVGIDLYNRGNNAQNNADEILSEYENSQAPSLENNIPETFKEHNVLGVIEIETINQKLPIIDETTTQTLELSCCYYKGALPGQKGNMVITGHNYANGSIFGDLDKLKLGDKVSISTKAETYIYKVYDTEVIMPDDVKALDEYEGDYALTLMTCTSNGNRRLLVRCSLTE